MSGLAFQDDDDPIHPTADRMQPGDKLGRGASAVLPPAVRSAADHVGRVDNENLFLAEPAHGFGAPSLRRVLISTPLRDPVDDRIEHRRRTHHRFHLLRVGTVVSPQIRWLSLDAEHFFINASLLG